MTTYEWITTFMGPVGGVIGWLAGTRMRRNQALQHLQTTIDLLAEKNRELYAENTQLRQEIAALREEGVKRDTKISELELQIEQLKK